VPEARVKTRARIMIFVEGFAFMSLWISISLGTLAAENPARFEFRM
jgi:hypothetical protein